MHLMTIIQIYTTLCGL